MNHTLIGLNLRMNAVQGRLRQVESAVLTADEHERSSEAEAAAAEHPAKWLARGLFGGYRRLRDKGSAVPGSRQAGRGRRHVR
ncbi:hypothetical protein PM3016_2633 [Paenibacillus mucilaginosus 3016]|uniref:Uncharacterized protein n=1 Tax=Paenibacillus mucilaginosus 3016 TaxID=1116391 RepID=H6NFA6_9BACL|nr:hypothetical protein [Paenibacillus mucilaginosus]AFC29515.1 hypothetical protein PM3016_2633 [Paenibacillus mucilaginosus 3016]WFA18216.1 hypothetical protein ERY13_13515 [Paenibacillus mucilaginosus]